MSSQSYDASTPSERPSLGDREHLALMRVWQASGAAPNPDDFKTSVRDAMWGQLVELLEQYASQGTRLHRENAELRAALAAAPPTPSEGDRGGLEYRRALARIVSEWGAALYTMEESVDRLVALTAPPTPVDREKLIAEAQKLLDGLTTTSTGDRFYNHRMFEVDGPDVMRRLVAALAVSPGSEAAPACDEWDYATTEYGADRQPHGRLTRGEITPGEWLDSLDSKDRKRLKLWRRTREIPAGPWLPVTEEER